MHRDNIFNTFLWVGKNIQKLTYICMDRTKYTKANINNLVLII